ncbi:Transglycosylase associated protein [Granulibacter bethesdensis]|nr:Transglycosylase associated protein [Granulibacter bethesdensis]
MFMRHDQSGDLHQRRTAMFSLLWTILIGLIVGAVAKLIMPGRDPGGIIVTILLGIGGSLVATWLGRVLHWYGPEDGARFIGSVVGAIIILAIYRFIVGRSSNTV